MAIQYMKDWEACRTPPGSLWEALKFVLFPLCHFVQPILAGVHEVIPGFIICSVELQIQISLKCN